MTDIRRPDLAKEDLRDLFGDLNERSPQGARRYLRGLVAKIGELAYTPNMGARRLRTRPEIRSVPYRNHVVHYAVDTEGVIVLRVLHGASNWRRALEEN